MATVLDTLLIDQFTGGVNMPRAADDGKLARVYVDAEGNVNLEYVNLDVNNEVANVLDYGALGDGTTDDTAAFNNALASGKSKVYVPADGTYLINSLVTASASNQTIYFAPGAALLLPASGAGKLVVSGARTVIQGDPTVRFNVTGSATYTAVTISGAGARIDGTIHFEMNVNVANCTLLKLSGTYSKCADVVLTGVGSFLGAVETAGTFSDAGRVLWQMTDDGFTTRNYSWVVRFNATRSTVRGVTVEHGGRQLINAIVDVVGQHNYLYNPQFNSGAGAAYGILMRDQAEFLEVHGGEIVGNYLTNSVGVMCGTPGGGSSPPPAIGQLKAYDLKIRNWDIGCRITGTCDTPLFDGCTIANNKTAHVQIDSKRGAFVWPVSGCTFICCYSEEEAYPGCPFLHLKTGSFLGGVIIGGEIGYTGTTILVESTMDINTCEFYGIRLPAAGPTDAVATPNTLSAFYFGPCQQSGSNLVSKGTYAANAQKALDPVLAGLVIGTHDIGGTAENRMTKVFTDIYTANFGNLVAGASQQLDFAYTGVPTPTTGDLRVTMTNGLGNKAVLGIVFTWWISASGQISGTALNTSLATVNSISGGVRFVVTVFG